MSSDPAIAVDGSPSPSAAALYLPPKEKTKEAKIPVWKRRAVTIAPWPPVETTDDLTN